MNFKYSTEDRKSSIEIVSLQNTLEITIWENFGIRGEEMASITLPQNAAEAFINIVKSEMKRCDV